MDAVIKAAGGSPIWFRAIPRPRLDTTLAWFGYLFLLLPSLVVIPISFGDTNEFLFPPPRFSLQLYHKFFSNPSWWGAAVESLIIASGATAIALLTMVPAGYTLARPGLLGRRFIHLALLSPMLTPGVVMGLGYYFYFSRIGLVGSTIGVMLAHTVIVSPFVLVSAIAGFRHLDPTLETVARILGAPPLTIFFRVILPQVRTALASGALLAFLISFDEVVIAYFITSATSMTLPVKMYASIQWEISPIIAAVSSLLTALSLIFCVALMLLGNRDAKH